MRFRELLALHDADGSLLRLKKPVSPRFELASLLRQHEGQPVLFEQVVGAEGPVAGNLLSSMGGLCRSLGFTRGEWVPRLTKAIEAPGAAAEGTGDFDRLEPDLDRLPILTHYPHDQGPYITSAVVFARHHASRNLSFHRLAKIGKDRLVGRLVENRDLHALYTDAREHGEDIDVAIGIGNSAGVLVAGATSVARGVDELGIAATLEPGLSVCAARTNSTHYPTDTEIVLEGRILHDEVAREGPFVDLTNTYDGVRTQPVFVVESIARRRQATYHALLPGGNEHKILMGAPRTPTIHRALRDAGIDVHDVYLTEGGSGWLDAAISIRKHDDAEPRRAVDAAIRGHRSLKKITIVDDDVDVTDPNAVNYAVTMYWEAGKEAVLKGVKGSSLDPMATPDGVGSKIALDATRPMVVPPQRELKMRRAEPAPGP